MRSSLRLLPVLMVCILAGYFTGRALWPTHSDPPPPPAGAATADPPAAFVPAVELQDVASGQPRSTGDWTDKALVLNFWATWCTPCRREMPLLEQVHQQWGSRGVAILGIAIDRLEPVQTFIAEAGISYPILRGEREAMALAERLAPGFAGLPLTVIAAPGGEVLKRHVGELHAADLERIVAILNELLSGAISTAEARQRLQ